VSKLVWSYLRSARAVERGRAGGEPRARSRFFSRTSRAGRIRRYLGAVLAERARSEERGALRHLCLCSTDRPAPAKVVTLMAFGSAAPSARERDSAR